MLSGDGTFGLGHTPRVVLWRFGSSSKNEINVQQKGRNNQSDSARILKRYAPRILLFFSTSKRCTSVTPTKPSLTANGHGNEDHPNVL